MSTPLLGEQLYIAPPPPVQSEWGGLEMWLIDRYGNRWDVSDYESGVFFMPGVTGMSMPKLAHQTLTYANADGNVWNGLLVEAREVFWPTYIYHDGGSMGYLKRVAEFWDALNPWHTVRWFVRDITGSTRYLDVRLKDDGGAGNEIDDSFLGWSKHRIVLEAAQPMWRAVEPVTQPFSTGARVPFFGPNGNNGPPFYPARNAAGGVANIVNDSSVPLYVTWTLEGPLNPSTLGFGDYVIDVPLTINAGQTLVIDTNPEALTAYLYGVPYAADGFEVTDRMTGRFDAEPIPQGTTQLKVAYGGDGRITASITPSYWRAYA